MSVTISVDEFARALYARTVIVPSWDKEQGHTRLNFFNQAESLLKLLNDAGYEVVKKEEQAKAPETPVVPKAQTAKRGFSMPGSVAPVGEEKEDE